MAVSSKSPREMVWFFTALLRAQELAMKVRADAREQVQARSRPGNAVRLSRINLQVKLLSRVDEGIDHLHGVLHVDIVVTGAVDLQQMAFQVGGVGDGRTFF